MPRFREISAVGAALIAVSLAAGAAHAASLPIRIDGAFSDWNAAVTTDAAGDAGSSGIDFQNLWIANDQDWLFVRFDTGVEIEPDEGQDIRILIDADDNAGTGLNISGVGAELMWRLGQRSGTTHIGATQATTHAALGLVIAPTVSGTQFELAIRRNATTSGGAPIFSSNTLRVVVADFGPSGDAIGAGATYTFDATPQATPALGLGRSDPSHVRIASYNIEGDGLFDTNTARQAALHRIFDAVDADVWVLNEVWNHNASQVAQKLQQFTPAGAGMAWTAINPLQGVVVATRFPVLQSAVMPVSTRSWVAARIDPGAKLDTDIVVMGNHWKAFSGPANDADRQDQADGMVKYMADMRAGTLLGVQPNTPIVAGGDWNLVGIARPLVTARTGDIVNQTTWGPDSPLDWDGSDFDEVPARHPDQRVVYTWRDDFSSFYPGRLDWMFHTGSVLALANHFVLETRTMTPANLAAHGLLASDTEVASDHAPLVADFTSPGNTGVPGVQPTALRLAAPVPNPFTTITRIEFALPRPARVTLDVYDAGGRRVNRLVAGSSLPAGMHVLQWNGIAADGARLRPGVYVIVLDADGERVTRRTALVR